MFIYETAFRYFINKQRCDTVTGYFTQNLMIYLRQFNTKMVYLFATCSENIIRVTDFLFN